MKHNEGFLKVVEIAKRNVTELSIEQVLEKQGRNDKFIFIDVREDEEWKAGHAKGAIHLGKGVIERDIEGIIPDKSTEVVLYCGGGYRSALAAQSIQTMGYQKVISMDGGMKGWRARGLPEERFDSFS